MLRLCLVIVARRGTQETKRRNGRIPVENASLTTRRTLSAPRGLSANAVVPDDRHRSRHDERSRELDQRPLDVQPLDVLPERAAHDQRLQQLPERAPFLVGEGAPVGHLELPDVVHLRLDRSRVRATPPRAFRTRRARGARGRDRRSPGDRRRRRSPPRRAPRVRFRRDPREGRSPVTRSVPSAVRASRVPTAGTLRCPRVHVARDGNDSAARATVPTGAVAGRGVPVPSGPAPRERSRGAIDPDRSGTTRGLANVPGVGPRTFPFRYKKRSPSERGTRLVRDERRCRASRAGSGDGGRSTDPRDPVRLHGRDLVAGGRDLRDTRGRVRGRRAGARGSDHPPGGVPGRGEGPGHPLPGVGRVHRGGVPELSRRVRDPVPAGDPRPPEPDARDRQDRAGTGRSPGVRGCTRQRVPRRRPARDPRSVVPAEPGRTHWGRSSSRHRSPRPTRW